MTDKPLKEMTEEERKAYNCEAVKRYYRRNREKVLAYNREWRIKNKERFAAMKRAWEKANPDKVKAQKKRERTKHGARYTAYLSKWQKDNPEKCSAYRKKHYANNPETAFNSVYKRRHTLKADGGKLSRGLTKRLYVQQKGLCAICSLAMEGVFHRDHIIPISKGGKHEDSNIQLTHPKCNLSKGNKLATK